MKRLLLACLFAGSVASADTLVLKNGNTVEGRVTETETGWVLRVETGTITFEKDEVREVVRQRTGLDEIQEAVAALPPGDAEARYRLALRARLLRFQATADDLLAETLALDPDHEGAHVALGHVKKDGKWLTREESLAAAGYVLFEGEWLARAEVEGRLAERQSEKLQAETDAARAETERLKAETERTRAERDLIEERLARLEAEIDDDHHHHSWWLFPTHHRRTPRPTGILPVTPARTDDRFVEPHTDPYAAPSWAQPVR